MGEADHKPGDSGTEWIKSWIDEQREKVRRAAESGESQQSSTADGARNDPFASLAASWAQLRRVIESGFESLTTHLSSTTAPLGWTREHEQAWRDLLSAHAELKKCEADLHALWAQVQGEAFSELERLVRERDRAGQAPKTPRELYDLWIECGERAHAAMAHSEKYCVVQAAYANAAVRFRACQQDIIERVLKQYDLPTRSEINSLHRQVRELRTRLEQLESAPKSVAARKAAAKRATERKRTADRS